MSLSALDVKDVWRGSQRSLHINHPELLAGKLVLLHFREEVQVRTGLLCDNTTAVAYLCQRCQPSLPQNPENEGTACPTRGRVWEGAVTPP